MDYIVHAVTKSQTQLSDFHFTSLLPPYPNPSFQQPEHPLHSMCVLSYFSRVRLFETQWIKACQAPPSKGFSRQECWSGLSCPSPRDYLDPGIKSASLLSPALADGLFTTSATWEAPLLTVSQTVQAFSRVQLFAIPWTAARHTSLSITNPRSLLKLMSESVMPSNHLILCRPLLLLPPIPISIRVFPSESVLPIRWPKYWSFSFSISPSYENSVPISFMMDWLDLLAVSRVFSNTTVQKHQFFGAQLSL